MLGNGAFWAGRARALGGLAWLESVARRWGVGTGMRRVGAASPRTTSFSNPCQIPLLESAEPSHLLQLVQFPAAPPASLAKVHNILVSRVARYRQEESEPPAREAKFRPVSAWVTGALVEAYRSKGIRGLYSRQAELCRVLRQPPSSPRRTPC